MVVSTLLLFGPYFTRVFYCIRRLHESAADLNFVEMAVLVSAPVIFGGRGNFILVTFSRAAVGVTW